MHVYRGTWRPTVTARKCTIIVACLLLCAVPAQAGVSARDATGQLVSLDRPARRVVSLAPNITELLFSAGAGDRVVGVSEFSDYPEAAKALPRVGGAGRGGPGGGGGPRVDLERILALRPDLVVAWSSGNSRSDLQRLRALGVTVFETEPRRLVDIPRLVRDLGRLAGSPAPAGAAADRFDERVDVLRRRYAGRAPVRVFFQVEQRPLMTLNGEHLVSDVLDLCGGRNIYAALPTLVATVSLEDVLARRPDVVLVSAAIADVDDVVARWRSMDQLSAGTHVHAVPPDLLVRSTLRVADGAELVCGLLDTVRKDKGLSQRPKG
jgi:iron complex transport system substrate-binding protein